MVGKEEDNQGSEGKKVFRGESQKRKDGNNKFIPDVRVRSWRLGVEREPGHKLYTVEAKARNIYNKSIPKILTLVKNYTSISGVTADHLDNMFYITWGFDF